ncbi:GtrA family protein [Modestobacter sp. NPDC049651]|uniref:GtrA family protein n=1 Tax=unclassified Modestobacter TaxID=2643866 RepID=UPI0033FF24D1
MSCPSLLRRPTLGGTVDAQLHAPATTRVLTAWRRLRTRLHGDDGLAQFTRYVVVGVLSSSLYAVAFIGLAGGLGDQTANLAGSIGSTLLANELHRRLTFHAGSRVHWFTAQWEAGGVAAVGLVATSLALAGAHSVLGPIAQQWQLALIAAVTGLIGLVRFVALRSWVFAPATSHRG